MVNEFGRLIKRYRLARDMSLRDLGDASDVHYSYIAKLEKGVLDNPSREVVQRLAIALNAPVDEFEMAAGYLPHDQTRIASRKDGYDTALPADVQQALELIADKFRHQQRNGKH